MARPTRVRPSSPSLGRQAYAYQVKMAYIHLTGEAQPWAKIGIRRWDRLMREYWRDGVGVTDAARSIQKTETDEGL
jgi:hypothetical protein